MTTVRIRRWRRRLVATLLGIVATVGAIVLIALAKALKKKA